MSTQIVYVAIGRRKDGEVTRYTSPSREIAAAVYHEFCDRSNVYASAELTMVEVVREERITRLETFERTADAPQT